MYILKIKHNKRWILIQKMLKDRILKCILCSICPTIYVNKHPSRLTYGRTPAKGSNLVVSRNRRILNVNFDGFNLRYECSYCIYRYTIPILTQPPTFP